MTSLGLRVVLDTNIIISFHWGGVPRAVVEAWIEGKFQLVTSSPILEELKSVVARMRGNWEEEQDLLAIMLEHAPRIEPTERLDVVPGDPSDNRFLECAVEGRADYLVSGDAHLLNLGEFRGVKILTPRAFLDRLAHLGGR